MIQHADWRAMQAHLWSFLANHRFEVCYADEVIEFNECITTTPLIILFGLEFFNEKE